MPDAYKLLMRTSCQIGYVKRRPGRSGYHVQYIGIGGGFIFAQHGGRSSRRGRGNDTDKAAVPGCNEIQHEKIRWYSCQRNGHYSDQCPNQTGTNLAHMGVTLTQSCADIKHTGVLLNTYSANSASNKTNLANKS